jgi:predicted unusual protein kinase regulating ubiquinone biosynthesis (AarF/ABC1/UbiB family)
LANCEILEQFVIRHAQVEVFRPTKVVNEFARSMEDELDYTVEASHI